MLKNNFKIYKQFHTIKRLIQNTKKPDDLIQLLFDLEYGELNFIVTIENNIKHVRRRTSTLFIIQIEKWDYSNRRYLKHSKNNLKDIGIIIHEKKY